MGSTSPSLSADATLERARELRRRRQELRTALPFMLPGFLLVIVFVLYPLAKGVQMSLFDWNLMNPPDSEFVGLKHFHRALTGDPIFWTAVRNTTLYALITVPGQMLFGLSAAMLLNMAIRGRAFFRALYYLPVVTSWLVVSYLFAYLFSAGMGPVNFLVVEVLGLMERPVEWLRQTWTAQVPINLLGIWKGVGWNMVIFLAALQFIPQELYEAAESDGASGWQRFRYVTLPLLRPSILFVSVVLLIGAYNVFLSVHLLTGGGPQETTEVLLSYMYTQAFRYLDFGYGVTIGLLMGAGVIFISFTQRRLLRGTGPY